MVPPGNKPFDKRADPARWNNIWVPWYDELDKQKAIETMRLHKPLLSPTTVIYSLVILTILLGATAIIIKHCVFEDRDDRDNDLPECNKPGTGHVNNGMDQHCFENVACTS